MSVIGELNELERLKRLVASLGGKPATDQAPCVATFIAWARNTLVEREQRLSSGALEARFTGEKLFGETDGDAFSLQPVLILEMMTGFGDYRWPP